MSPLSAGLTLTVSLNDSPGQPASTGLAASSVEASTGITTKIARRSKTALIDLVMTTTSSLAPHIPEASEMRPHL